MLFRNNSHNHLGQKQAILNTLTDRAERISNKEHFMEKILTEALKKNSYSKNKIDKAFSKYKNRYLQLKIT